MAKYSRYIVYTDDGEKHYLPDYVTDENYSIEKEKFLSSYNPSPTTPEVIEPVSQEESSYGEIIKGSGLQVDNALRTNELGKDAVALNDAQSDLDIWNSIENTRALNDEEEEARKKLISLIDGTNETDEEREKRVVKETAEARAKANIPYDKFQTQEFINTDNQLIEKDKGLKKNVGDNLKVIQKNNEYLGSLNHSEAFNKLQESDRLRDTFDFLNPLSDTFDPLLPLEVMSSSLVPMAASLTAGATATISTGGNVFAGAVATGMTSGAIDNAFSYVEYFQKKGMDINNPQSVAKFMGDEKLVAEAKRYARIRGTAVGSLDALSFGMGTRVLNPLGFQNMFARQAMNVAIQTPLQGALGGLGEASAQYFTLEEGESLDIGAINMEIVGELAFAPAEIAIGQAATGFSEHKKQKAYQAEKQYRIAEDFFKVYLAQLSESGFSNQASEIAGVVSDKAQGRIDSGEDPLIALNETIEEFESDMPGFAEAFNIYKSFTDDAKNPKNFPSKVVTENTETPNVFLIKANADKTFSIVDYQNNPLINPKTNQPFPAYDSENKAKVVSSGLNLISQTQYSIEKNSDYILMQNLDRNNPTVTNLGLKVINPYYDGVSFAELNEIGVSPQIIKTIQDATGNNNNVPISQLKNILSKAQFDKVMTGRSENLRINESPAPKSISIATIKKLLKNKNIENDINTDSFKRLALHFTGESNIENMSVAQRRVLHSMIDSLPPSLDLISLPDFTNRSYTVNDYSKAVDAIEESKNPTLKVIKEATGLNNSEAKRIKEDLIISGYIKNDKWVGTGNQIYNFDGTVKFSEDVEVNKKLDKLVEDVTKANPEMTVTFTDFIAGVKGKTEVPGAYNRAFNEILITLDRTSLEYRNNPEKYLIDLAGTMTHETWHSLRQADVFTQSEYDTLKQYALTQKPVGTQQTYYEQAVEQYTSEEALAMGAVKSDADVLEEAIARVFEDFAKNKKNVTGKPQQILTKVESFFAKFNNSLNGNGFTTAADILDRVTTGQIGSRDKGVVRTTLETDRLSTGFANIFKEAEKITKSADANQLEEIDDSPSLKYSLSNNQPASPLVNEFLSSLSKGAFGNRIDQWANVLDGNSDTLNKFLINRRKQNLNNEKDIRATKKYIRNVSTVLARMEINKGTMEVNSDGTIPMYMVGDLSKNSQTILHQYENDAVNTAQLRGNINYKPQGNINKVSKVNVPITSISIHPSLFNAFESSISNPFKREGLFPVDTMSISTNIESEQKVIPVIGNQNASASLKYSLKRTEGRLTSERISEIRNLQNSNANIYQVFRDRLTGVEEMGGLDFQLLDAVITDIENQGSDSIAAMLERDEDYIQSNLGLPLYRMGMIEEILNEIENITFNSMKDFPEFIVVYRGGAINPNYDVVPVTMDQTIAEDFASGRLESGYRVSDDDVLTEYLVPKSKVLADVNAIAATEQFTDPDGRIYSRQYEQELLVNVNDLVPSKLDRLGPLELKSIRNRILEEKATGEKSIKQFDEELQERIFDVMMSPSLGLGSTVTLALEREDGTVKDMTDRDYNNALNDLKKLLDSIELGNITQKKLSNMLQHPALIEAEKRMFSQPIVDTKIKSEFLVELIKKAISYAEGTVATDKKATFIIGLPASGKSFFAEQIARDTKSTIIDSDDAKKLMPEFRGGLGANATAPVSSKYATVITDQLSNMGVNIIIPSVGGSKKFGSLEKKIQMLKDKGYTVDAILVDTDFNHALVRMMNRFVSTGRLIATDYFLDVENTPRDTYNRLKESGLIDNYAFLNNNFLKGEQTVEEDTAKLLQVYGEPRQVGIGDVRRSYEGRSDFAEAIEEAVRETDLQKQKSIEAGVTPVISDNASPEAKLSAINAQKDIKNISTINLDVDSIIDGIDNNTNLKYSFKNSGKPLKPSAERLVKKMTVRDSIPETDTITNIILKAFKSVNPRKFREAILDQYALIAENGYEAAKKSEQGEAMMSAAYSAIAAMYHSDRSGDIYQQAFMHGAPVYNKKKGFTTVVDISPQDGKPIKAPHEIFKNAYNNPQLMWAFQAVLAVKRETRFNAEGRKVKINAQDIKDGKIALQEHPEIQGMIDDYQRWNSHLVRFLIDTGVLTEKTGNIWTEHADYIPFFRAIEGDENFKGPQIFQGMQLSPFKTAKGSETKNIVDPITGITQNARAAINAGMKNVAANRTMRDLVITGGAENVKNNTPGNNIIKVKVKGQTKSFRVDDPDNYNLFTIMSGGAFLPQNMIMKLARGTKQVTSDLITRMPDFWFRQILRDSVSAWALSGANYVPVLSQLKESASISYGMLTGNLPKEYIELRNAGIIQGYERGVRDIDTTEALIKKAYKKERYKERTTLSKVALAPFDAVTKIWDLLGQGTAITDAATRVSVYKDTLKRTGDVAEALSQAMEVLNFTRRGNNEVFQIIAQSSMFLNPRLQGVDVFYRGLTGQYGIGKKLSRKKRAGAVALRVLSMMSLMPYYYFLVKDSEEWEEASEETKDNYIIVPGSKKLIGAPIGLPLPFEVGFFTVTVPMRLMAYTFGDDTKKDLTESMKRNISSTLKVNPLEITAVQPILENYFNYDFYTGRRIVPQYLEDLDDLAYRPGTDTIYKKVGDELNMSPLYIENLVSGYTGTAGTYAMSMVEKLLTLNSDTPTGASMRVDQLPVVGAFLLPAEGNRLENQFFDLKEMVDTQVESFRVLEKKIIDEGDMGALDMLSEYRIEYADVLKSLEKDLKKTSDQLAEIRQAKAIIQNSNSLDGDEKRDQILELNQIENTLLRASDVSGIRKFFIEDIQPKARVN